MCFTPDRNGRSANPPSPGRTMTTAAGGRKGIAKGGRRPLSSRPDDSNKPCTGERMHSLRPAQPLPCPSHTKILTFAWPRCITDFKKLSYTKDTCISAALTPGFGVMTIIGYTRVSTDGQTLDSQIATLKAAGAARIYRETASGAKSRAQGAGARLEDYCGRRHAACDPP
jgi:hypothetical protein